jgi:hypothetical protein
LKGKRGLSKRILDLCFLIGSALLLCVVGGGAFVITEIRHISPMWVFLSLISIGFFAAVGWDYRKEFRSVRFVLFFCGWLVVNIAVFVEVVASFGWLYWIPALFLELFFFYATADWLFGLKPPLRRGRGRQT